MSVSILVHTLGIRPGFTFVLWFRTSSRSDLKVPKKVHLWGFRQGSAPSPESAGGSVWLNGLMTGSGRMTEGGGMLRWLLLLCLCSSVESQEAGNDHKLKHGECKTQHSSNAFVCKQAGSQLLI